MSDTRQGPTQAYICNGCKDLKTHHGLHESHHSCRDGAWNSVIRTEHGENVTTPNTCTYMKTLIN